jgi:hypothetical protein
MVQTLLFTRLFTSAIFPGRGKTICSFSQQPRVLGLNFEIGKIKGSVWYFTRI